MAPTRSQSRTPEPSAYDSLTQNLQQLTQVAQTLSNAILQNNNRPAPPNRNSDIARQVSSHRPPIFLGEEDPTTLEEWIRTFDKIFEVVECPEGRRVELASFYFGHEADLWWVHEGPTYRQEPGFNWESMKARLRGRFYPAHIRAAMYEEFLHLKQGMITVMEYHK
ncbi:PREDICTED: uncharacterized protein LOC109157312 [Ipomoea nil]|uniref:uncharacterized protein LOC109157312 n=1 Tax=Ipomoea nil TaxID=35883 RepID=UPI00090197BB|nr:PREDICTED: uncharacterized protein LOC109157312 [Ipomoea nil]